MDAKSILKKYYGYDQFRNGQEELISVILEGRDVVGILPTGGGKSICYQVPALLLQGVTLVISPLISLMKDQVDTLKEYGISAELINSTLSTSEFREVLSNAREGAYKLLYVAPERLETESFLSLLQTLPISMIAVDEAHCISQWGHDFRPSYRRINSVIQVLKNRPIIAAFTATATPQVREDIKSLLGLQAPFEYFSTFDRGNLYFEVRKPQNKLKELVEYIKQHEGESGIIYCSTKKTVDEVCERLKKLNISVTKYHAGLKEDERSTNQEDFLYDRIPLIVATNAFGMGIDKSNVRYVVHYNMPKNMESYYQEAGRAGRDGEPSECILLFNAQDIMTCRFLIENGNTSNTHSKEYEKLNSMVDYCNTGGCLRSYILKYFGETPKEEACQHCGNCNNDTEETDITIEAQKIMSCIKRMHEQFGSTQVVDVLRGANTERIRSLHFFELSTYGIMREYSKDTLKELISYLIAEGYVDLEGDKYPVLKLNEASYGVLKGEKRIKIRKVIVKIEKGTKAAKQLEEDANVNIELFEQLRKLRYELAQEQHVQPFMIFPDTSLKDMARKYPTTKSAMLDVVGVGEYKFEKYGELFMQAIESYVRENNIVKQAETEEHELPKQTHHISYVLYKEGRDIAQIARYRGLKPTTIESHLLKCVEEGLEINFDDFIPQEHEKEIIEVIQQADSNLLRPIKESLPEEITYTAIKFVIAKYNFFKNI